MRLMQKTILALFLTASVICVNGCSTTSVFVLDQAELIRVKTGQNITAKYDGWLLSDRAVNRVMNAKIKAVNLE
jgi:hypothetical protein